MKTESVDLAGLEDWQAAKAWPSCAALGLAAKLGPPLRMADSAGLRTLRATISTQESFLRPSRRPLRTLPEQPEQPERAEPHPRFRGTSRRRPG